MIVLDTHAWLWWIGNDPRLSRRARRLIQADSDLAVSTISIWEAATLDRRARIRLLPNVSTWVGRATGGSGISAIAVSPEIAMLAAALPSSFSGDPADRIVYATASASGSQLVTKDRAIASHDATRVIW